MRFELNGIDLVAELGPAGWTIPGDHPELAELPAFLGRLMRMMEGGPAAGDPVRRAAAEAAHALGGTVVYVRPAG